MSPIATIATLAVGLVAAMLAGCDGSDRSRPADEGRAPAASSAPPLPTAGERPRGVVEDCSRRSEGSFPRPFSDPANLTVGPLVLFGAGGTPGFVSDFARDAGGNKFPLFVRAGHRVTVELPRRVRRGAGLAYGPLPGGVPRLADTHPVVTFIACRRGEVAQVGRLVPFWSGGVLARSPRCVPLNVWIDDERSPRRAVLRLGVRGCS